MRLNATNIFSSIQLSQDGTVPNEVQVLRVGKFNHPRYGKFEVTTKTLSEMKDNFDKRVRGIDVAFDYFHNSDQEASAWAKELKLKENGTELWAVVDWTPKAQKKLSERELRYFSPDFAFKWVDPESGKTFNNVLFGGGLTNRPFVKEMQAIVADESKGKENMNELEQAQAKIKEIEAKNLTLSEEKTSLEKKLSEMPNIAEMKKENETLKADLEKVKADLAKATEAKVLAEKETKFNLLLTEGKACAAQKAAFLKGDMEEFIKLAEPVNTKAQGTSEDDSALSYEDRVLKLAEEKQSKDKTLDFGQAVKLAKQEIKK